MARKEFSFKGKSLEEIKKMSVSEFMEYIPARRRRTLKRGFTEEQKPFIQKLQSGKNNIETHCRDLVITPEYLDKTIKIHNGKEFVPILIEPEMLGHVLGEFSITRKKLAHSSPGVGATRSSSNVSVK